MEYFWILILVSFFAINSPDKTKPVQLEKLPLQTFDELFVDEWWNKYEAEGLKTPAPTNFGQNVHHQIDRQNIQIGQIKPNSTDHLGQIEPNSTDQLGQIELISTDQLGQIEPNSTDQLGQIELNSTDQLGQIKPNSTDHSGQIEPNSNDQLGQIEPNSTDQLEQIELNSTDHLGQIEPNSTDQLGQIEPNSTDQLGQIEPNSTDQLGQIESNSTDQLGQIEPNSTDQNGPLTESDHSNNAKNDKEQNELMKENTSPEIIAEDERKLKIVYQFLSIKDEFKQKGKFPYKERTQIEQKIAKHLIVNRLKIYEWKKEFGLSRKMFNEKEERKHLVEKFDQKKAELKRAGLKNSYKNEIDKTVAKKLGLSFVTIYNWKRDLGQSTPKLKYSDSEQKELMKSLE